MDGLLPKREKLVWVTSIISINLLLQIILSYRLWFSTVRDFPMVSAFAGLDLAGLGFLEYPLFAILLLSLVGLILKPEHSLPWLCFFLVSGVLILQDINRLQPWFYQMSLLLLLLFFTKKEKYLASSMLCFALIATYFWSGFHKFNIYFVEDIFPWLFAPLGLEKFLTAQPQLGFLAATIELLLALSLVWRTTRKLGVSLLLCFHGLILALLGPFGHQWNVVVWPWNLAMMALVYVLFFGATDIWKSFGKQLGRRPVLFIFILLFGFFPALNEFGYWDDPLSFKMYAGTHPEGSIFFYKKEEDCFPNYVKKDIFGKDRKRLVIDKWSFTEMNVAPYNAPRVLKRIGREICTCMKDSENSHFEVLTVSRWNRTEQYFDTQTCKDLLQ
ncbi:MAG: hypothetical protein AB8G15_21720 [Saprospiraceae bacterium]